MSGGFEDLFGEGEKAKVVAGSSPFAQLPQFGREAFGQAVQGIQGLDPSVFAPSALTAPQLQGIQQLQQFSQPFDQASFQEQLNIFQNPFEEQVLQNTFSDIQQQGRLALGDIGSGATAAGGFGGERQALLERGTLEDISRTIGRVGASTRAGNFQDAADRALGNIGLGRQGAFDQLTAGGILQQQATAEQQAPLTRFNALLGAAKGIPTASGAIATTNDVGALGQFQQGTQGLASLGALLSDERLKENIKHVGKENGHNVYEFSYKADKDKTMYVGVMAQEVEQTNPEAITETMGIKAVYYNKIGVEFRRAV